MEAFDLPRLSSVAVPKPKQRWLEALTRDGFLLRPSERAGDDRDTVAVFAVVNRSTRMYRLLKSKGVLEK